MPTGKARLFYPTEMKTILGHRQAFSLIAALCFVMTASAQGLNELVLTHAVDFIGTPYVAHTLDRDAEHETLVANCDEVDCTTFVEYVLARTLTYVEGEEPSEQDFLNALQSMRYRNGVIDGYASRLHYFTEWIYNALRHGLVEDITAKNSSYTTTVEVGYMTAHPDQYPQLVNSEENRAKIRETELVLTGKEVQYLPKDKLPHNGLPWIKAGDIIAITGGVSGLDIAHLGFAFYVEGKLSLLHASSIEGKVTVSNLSLAQMLNNHKTWTGIRVLRLKKSNEMNSGN